MNDAEFHRTVIASPRVRELLAIAIRTAAQRRLGVYIEESSACQMADIHTLTSALNSIHQKLAMNVHLPRQKNSAIAIAEVRIDGPFGCAGDHRIKSIVALREEAIAVDVHGESMRQSHADAERELFRLRQQIATWAELLRRYLKEFAVLYQARQRELDEIRLPTPQASAAREELDRVFSRCLEAFCERIR